MVEVITFKVMQSLEWNLPTKVEWGMWMAEERRNIIGGEEVKK